MKLFFSLKKTLLFSLSFKFLTPLQWQALSQHPQHIDTVGSAFPQRTCSTTIKKMCKRTRKAPFLACYCREFSDKLNLYKIVFLCSSSVKWMWFSFWFLCLGFQIRFFQVKDRNVKTDNLCSKSIIILTDKVLNMAGGGDLPGCQKLCILAKVTWKPRNWIQIDYMKASWVPVSYPLIKNPGRLTGILSC